MGEEIDFLGYLKMAKEPNMSSQLIGNNWRDSKYGHRKKREMWAWTLMLLWVFVTAEYQHSNKANYNVMYSRILMLG